MGVAADRGDALTMSQAQAVAETDRLPWLADEPLPEAARIRPGMAVLAIAVALIVAAAAYWISSHAIERPVGAPPAPPPVNAERMDQPPAAAPEQVPALPR